MIETPFMILCGAYLLGWLPKLYFQIRDSGGLLVTMLFFPFFFVMYALLFALMFGVLFAVLGFGVEFLAGPFENGMQFTIAAALLSPLVFLATLFVGKGEGGGSTEPTDYRQGYTPPQPGLPDQGVNSTGVNATGDGATGARAFGAGNP